MPAAAPRSSSTTRTRVIGPSGSPKPASSGRRPSDRVGDQHAVHRLREARGPRSVPRPAPPDVSLVKALERLEQALALRVAAPLVRDRSTFRLGAPSRRRSRVTSTGASATVPDARCRAGSPAPARASPGSALTSGRSSGTSTVTRPARPWHRQDRGADHLVERHGHCLDAERPGLEPARVEQVRRRPRLRRSADSSIVASSSPRCSSDHSTSVWRSVLTDGLDAGQGRAQVVPNGREERRPLPVGCCELAGLAGALRSVADPRTPSARLRRRPAGLFWSSAKSAGPRPISRRSVPIGTSKRSGASLPRGRPARVVDVDPVARGMLPSAAA